MQNLALVTDYDSLMNDMNHAIKGLSSHDRYSYSKGAQKMSAMSDRVINLINEIVTCNDIVRMQLLKEKLEKAMELSNSSH